MPATLYGPPKMRCGLWTNGVGIALLAVPDLDGAVLRVEDRVEQHRRVHALGRRVTAGDRRRSAEDARWVAERPGHVDSADEDVAAGEDEIRADLAVRDLLVAPELVPEQKPRRGVGVGRADEDEERRYQRRQRA